MNFALFLNKIFPAKLRIKRLLNILNPQPLIGGLEINDSYLRFILLEGGRLSSASLKLPVGVIEEGKVKNVENFKVALAQLHSQITRKQSKKIYTIINVPDINVYTQIFNLPLVAAGNLNEAARLNLQMISPTDFSSVYADWQQVGKNEADGQLEILGAFISRQIIDDISHCLRETNFIVVAIEFSGLALSRLVSGLRDLADPSILLRLDSVGLNFSLIKNRNLYFNHFVPWPVKETRQISLAILKDLIVRETQKVLNFSDSRWPSQLATLFLIAPALEDKISQIITENFSLSVQKITLPAKLSFSNHSNQLSITNNQLPSLSSDWFNVLGSALRGLIPRAKDIIISLASTGTEEEFRQYQIISFIKIWRNIFIASLSFIVVAFIAVEGFLIKTANSLNEQVANLSISNAPAINEINQLKEQAEKFNRSVDLAIQAQKQIIDWPPIFEKIKGLAGSDVIIDRIFIQSPDLPILFNGRAADETTILRFKNTLEQDPQFQEINMPLAGITPSSDGLMSFNLTFKLKLK